MNVDFSIQVWPMLFSGGTFLLAAYGVVSARSRASAKQLEKMSASIREEMVRADQVNAKTCESIRKELAKAEQSQSNRTAHMGSKCEAEIKTLREQVINTNGNFGQRIQALETSVENGIDKNDLHAVHKRVDDLHTLMGGMRSDLGTVKGILEGWQRTQSS